MTLYLEAGLEYLETESSLLIRSKNETRKVSALYLFNRSISLQDIDELGRKV